jgi:hypothetical protein
VKRGHERGSGCRSAWPVPRNPPKGQSMQWEQGDFRVYECQQCSSSPTRMSRSIRASRFPIGHSMSAGEHACKRWQLSLGGRHRAMNISQFLRIPRRLVTSAALIDIAQYRSGDKGNDGAQQHLPPP